MSVTGVLAGIGLVVVILLFTFPLGILLAKAIDVLANLWEERFGP